MMSPVDKLLAIEEIRQLKARYTRYVDSQDWESWRKLLTDDAIFGPLEPDPNAEATDWIAGAEASWDSGRLVGADQIVAAIAKGMIEVKSVHMVFQNEIEILSENEARAVWGMEDILRFPTRLLKGYGYYKEAYVRQDGDWKIRHFHVLRKYVEYQDFAATNARII